MSKTLIIYKSNYGATKSYAEYIAHEINANVKSYNKVKKSDILAANTIVFGGSVFVSKLSILKTVKKYQPLLKQKNIYLFAVGLTEHEQEAIPRLEVANPDIHSYTFKSISYFPGTFDVSKMNWFHRTLLTMVKKMMTNKPDITGEEKELCYAIDNPQDKRDMHLTHTLIKELED